MYARLENESDELDDEINCESLMVAVQPNTELTRTGSTKSVTKGHQSHGIVAMNFLFGYLMQRD